MDVFDGVWQHLNDDQDVMRLNHTCQQLHQSCERHGWVHLTSQLLHCSDAGEWDISDNASITSSSVCVDYGEDAFLPKNVFTNSRIDGFERWIESIHNLRHRWVANPAVAPPHELLVTLDPLCIHALHQVLITWHRPSFAQRVEIFCDPGDGKWQPHGGFSELTPEHVDETLSWTVHGNGPFSKIRCARLKFVFSDLVHADGWLCLTSLKLFGRSVSLTKRVPGSVALAQKGWAPDGGSTAPLMRNSLPVEVYWESVNGCPTECHWHREALRPCKAYQRLCYDLQNHGAEASQFTGYLAGMMDLQETGSESDLVLDETLFIEQLYEGCDSASDSADA